MAVMERNRTEERIDQLEILRVETKEEFTAVRGEMRAGFEAVDKQFDKIDKRFEAMTLRFDALHDQLYSLNCTLVAALLAAFVAVLATQL